MLGDQVSLFLVQPDETINGELRQQTAEGVWVYFGWAEKAALHFYPQHRIREIVSHGRTPR